MSAATTSPMERAMDWLASDDTGLSSETMCWYFLRGKAPERLHGFPGPCHPLDPSDFGRCLRLLQAIPEWRSRLPELAQLSPQWAALVANWDRIEALYLEERPSGRAARCYAAMKELGL